MNNWTGHGFVGNDPKIRTTESGKKVAAFSIVTTSFRKDASGNKISTWHNIIAWDKTAEYCEKYVKKGSELVITGGEIQYRTYVDKEGITKYITEIVCQSVESCGKKEADTGFHAKDEFSGSANKEAIVNKTKEASENDELGDLPF